MSSTTRDVQDNNSAEGHTANLSSVSSELTSLSGDKRPVPRVNESNDSQRQSFHKKKKNKSNPDQFNGNKKETQFQRIQIIESKTDSFCILEITELHCRHYLHKNGKNEYIADFFNARLDMSLNHNSVIPGTSL